MTRRRLLLFAAVGIAGGVAPLGYAVRSQFRLERQLVGTWRCIGPNDLAGIYWVFSADGDACCLPPRFRCGSWCDMGTLYWSVYGTKLTFGPKRLFSIVRLLAGLSRRNANPDEMVYRFEVTANRLVLIGSDGRRCEYTRVPDDEPFCDETR
jgi:hypothetical protein